MTIYINPTMVTPNPQAAAMGAKPEYQHGMELRDWFAGQVLPGNLSFFSDHDVSDYSEMAHDAYMLADAMMEARKK